MQQSNRPQRVPPILILGVLFFIFGFVTWLNSTLVQYLKIACELTNFQSFWVTFAFYISYFVMALPASAVLQKTGFKNGMMLGLMIMALGALLFIPAAHTRTYGVFLAGLFIIGTGLSILQTASNPYVTILGPIESAAQRISIMGICNKVAGTIAPIILGTLVLSDADSLVTQLAAVGAGQKEQLLNGLAARVILPYAGMAMVLLALAMLVRFSTLPEIEVEEEENPKAIPAGAETSVFGFPHLILGVIALFLYVGVEVMAGDTIGIYGHAIGIPLSAAKFFPACTLSAMVVGYLVGIFAIPKYITQAKALLYSAVLGVILSVLAIITTGNVSVLFIALLGLANALMWPAIWPLAIDGLGKFIKTGSALLIMAIVGGALLPPLWGKLADITSIGYQQAYWIMVPCYLFILFYSVKGYKIKRWG
jgi:FHS family L-fucose permease-like MFS transporter